MGGRGAFLESGGFSGPARWRSVGEIDGIKILIPTGPKMSMNLPDRSNTPGTTYMSMKNGKFSQLRVFGMDRIPVLDIDYGYHQGVKTLHAHDYVNGIRVKGARALTPAEITKYKNLFKGVEL